MPDNYLAVDDTEIGRGDKILLGCSDYFINKLLLDEVILPVYNSNEKLTIQYDKRKRYSSINRI